MPVNNSRYHRRSIRLPEYDYTQAGAYYVTICTLDRMCLFGDVVNGEMALNEYGRIARDEWIRAGELRPNVKTDAFVVMPNHIHGIVVIGDNDYRRGTMHRAPTKTERFGKPVAGSLPTIVRCYTAAVTRHINRLRNTPGAKLWQRNYWEHVIRNGREMEHIRRYIIENPMRWKDDGENPGRPFMKGSDPSRPNEENPTRTAPAITADDRP